MKMPEDVKNNRKLMGRPTKLTPEVQKKIVDAIESCGHIDTAAAYAGISKFSFHEWLKRGARSKRGIYKDFSNAVEKAVANAMMERVNVNRKAANGYETVTQRAITKYNSVTKQNEIVEQTVERSMKFDARAAEWWLERRFPQIFGRKEHVEISGDQDNPVLVEQKPQDILSGEYLAKWLVALTEVNLAPIDLVKMIDVIPMNGINGNGNGSAE